jgi:anti-sigma factor RsiW
MRCDDSGRLRAYLDNALVPAEQAALAQHLSGCPACRVELATLQKRSSVLSGQLAALNPERDPVPDVVQALEAFRASIPATHAGAQFKEMLPMIRETLLTGWRRTALIGATALACLLILFSFAPARQAAADFLGIFRVRKFAVIPIDPAQAQRLDDLAHSMGADAFGEPTVLREEGQPQIVADAAEASAIAGFAVRVPAALPDGATLRRFTTQAGPALRFETDRATMQAVLTAAGIEGATLPEVDKVTVGVDVPTTVRQEYQIGAGATLSLTQLPSPQISLPDGVAPEALGEIALQLLGMPQADAHNLAQTIDWTTTVVIPMPTDIGLSQEVTVDGVTGLLIEGTRKSGSPRRDNLVLWERDGIVYAIEANNVDALALLQAADSLR